jgi:hypothetical protein
MIPEKELSMAFDILRLPAAQTERLAPVAPRAAPLFCLALLTAGCALASFAFACATPFAAFAVVAAAMLPLPAALVVMAAAFIVNQAIGFGVLGYPHDATTISWGVAIGVAALAATVSARAVLRLLPRAGTPVALGAAAVAAFAAYEAVLAAVTPFLGGAGAFTASIVARIGVVNLLWLIGLVAVCAACRLATGLRTRHAPS